MQLAAAREIRRVLRPGGTVMLADLDVTGAGFGTRLHLRLAGMSRMRRYAPALEPLLITLTNLSGRQPSLLPLDGGTADVVVSTLVLHHLPSSRWLW